MTYRIKSQLLSSVLDPTFLSGLISYQPQSHTLHSVACTYHLLLTLFIHSLFAQNVLHSVSPSS